MKSRLLQRIVYHSKTKTNFRVRTEKDEPFDSSIHLSRRPKGKYYGTQPSAANRNPMQDKPKKSQMRNIDKNSNPEIKQGLKDYFASNCANWKTKINTF